MNFNIKTLGEKIKQTIPYQRFIHQSKSLKMQLSGGNILHLQDQSDDCRRLHGSGKLGHRYCLGAQFGYTLLSVILISNIFAMVLQHLSVKLGVVAERDLAQACRDHFNPTTNFILWVFCEIAIAACDLAEGHRFSHCIKPVIPYPADLGIVITTVDVLIILLLQSKGFRWIESIVGGLIFIILACFVYEIIISQPAFNEILGGLVPQKEIIQNPPCFI